uniref:DNA-directed RNA polymerase subunit beta'' n=1 Tax=Ginkgo biloba TaxID=3311 RepID=A0A2S1VZY1_GINBI|nr:RNA polymerase beta subunit-2 [Ginkgo biloba]AWJ59874.1 RNA polymerase beta subunit-2 [Ginkgo biloba]AWJ60129.1 RNA polymerase beta subunit-2 [Ginkgo biloba]AWJ60299.1 RNA polymerase beta subunit-2 [Ginkgo biloba]
MWRFLPMTERAKLLFHNKVMNRIATKQLISRLIDHFGMTYTSHISDQLKASGFQQATDAAISLGIDDLLTAPSRGWLVRDAEQQGSISEKHHHYGNVYAVEKLRQSIETWYATSEYLRQEMNPNFGMTDPSNPVHMMSFSGARGNTSQVHQLVGMRGLVSDPQGQIIDLPIQRNFREGLSLTEYIISCYGARKGVVDTAVRTSDAGYLTRRLVEVVQHIVVRRADCGTIRGISVSPIRGRERIKKEFVLQTLIGRVLADDVHINKRCIATRNQDIGVGLADQLRTLRTQPIYIRTPPTCKSLSRICRLCYGRSPTHSNLIELGEAVGIIAGQSIGEPGTQLTLRTFHTGGVFTGDIAEHVRAPFNGKIQFNENLVHPTRTRHGHPASICHNELSITIDGQDQVHSLTIPSQSLLLVQNDQYVESEQVIAEARARTSPSKEKVMKHIYSDLEGEMHWSTNVCHAPENVHGNVHLILRTSYLWVLSGGLYESGVVPFPLYKDQDQVNIQFPLAKHKSLSDSSVNQDRVKHKSVDSNFSGKEEKISGYSGIDRIMSNEHWDSIYSTIPFDNCKILGKKQRNRLIVPLRYDKEREKRRIPCPNYILRIPRNFLFQRNHILAVLDDPQYRVDSSGILKYGNIRIDSIEKKDDFLEDQGSRGSRPKYEIEGGRFLFIPEEVHILHESSSIMVRNGSIIRTGTQITFNIESQVGGLVRIERMRKKIEVRILPGDIYFPGEIHEISRHNGTLIPPGKIIFDEFQSVNWIYFQWITPHKEKPFVPVRSAAEYGIHDGSNRTAPFYLDLLGEEDNLQVQVGNYILYGDGEQIQVISDTSIQLVRTCSVLNWEQKDSMEEAYAFLTEVRINEVVRNFLQISLMKYPGGKRKNVTGSKFLFHNRSDQTNTFSSNRGSQFFSKHQGTIRTLPNEEKEGGSFAVLSPSDCSRTVLFSGSKYYDTVKRSIQEDPMMQIIELSGLLGNLHSIANRFPSPHLITYNKVLSNKHSISDNSGKVSQVSKCYFMGGNTGILNFDSCRNIIFNLFNSNWCSPLSNFCKKKLPAVSLGQLIRESVCISEDKPLSGSGQIIAVHEEYLVIRSAKPYLATRRAAVHGHYGEFLDEGDTLITLIYERSKSGDTIQGLPKVEQLSEARSINPIPRNLEESFEDWNEDMTRSLGSLWGLFISARITMEQSQIHLVNQIQKVYRSQGVRIYDKHIEIIVRQMTSKVFISGDGMADVFSPGELIELSRAQRMNRALEEAIYYRTVLLGITRASLDTQSFISGASFQETARVLAKAALRGRIDWLKGLKENVILGGIIPAGTGFKRFLRHSEERNKIDSRTGNKNLFNNKVKDIFSHHGKVSVSPIKDNYHNTLKQPLCENSVDK